MSNAQIKYHMVALFRLDNGQQLYMSSHGHQTSYIVSGTPSRGGTAYLIEQPSHSVEEAIETLFKKLVMDDREVSINYYNLVSEFFIKYFDQGATEYKATLSGRWHNLFLHVELERTEGLSGSLMFFRVHDKEMLVPLYTHPMVHILASKV
jgi:hypothetical protein